MLMQKIAYVSKNNSIKKRTHNNNLASLRKKPDRKENYMKLTFFDY